MNTLLLLLLFLVVSSQTYISYISFLLAMIEIVFLILLLGNYYLSLVYLMIYVGSIAILFIYILMVLSIIEPSPESYLLFILPFTTISIIGLSIPYYNEISTILTISYSIYTSLIIPIGILLFLAMIFAIRSI